MIKHQSSSIVTLKFCLTFHPAQEPPYAVVRHHRSVQYPHKGTQAHWPPPCSAQLHPNHCGFVLLNILTSTKNTLKDTLQYPPFALEFMKTSSKTHVEIALLSLLLHKIMSEL